MERGGGILGVPLFGYLSTPINPTNTYRPQRRKSASTAAAAAAASTAAAATDAQTTEVSPETDSAPTAALAAPAAPAPAALPTLRRLLHYRLATPHLAADICPNGAYLCVSYSTHPDAHVWAVWGSPQQHHSRHQQQPQSHHGGPPPPPFSVLPHAAPPHVVEWRAGLSGVLPVLLTCCGTVGLDGKRDGRMENGWLDAAVLILLVVDPAHPPQTPPTQNPTIVTGRPPPRLGGGEGRGGAQRLRPLAGHRALHARRRRRGVAPLGQLWKHARIAGLWVRAGAVVVLYLACGWVGREWIFWGFGGGGDSVCIIC